MKKSTLVLIHVVLPLVLGATIYTLWRSSRLLVFRWYGVAGLSGWVSDGRILALPYRHVLPSWALYSLPDALWVYSFTSSLVLIWAVPTKASYYSLWIALPCLLALGGEFGQMLHLVPGTFDWSDVIVYVVAGVLGLVLPNAARSKHQNY